MFSAVLQYLATWLLITPPFTLLFFASWPKSTDRPLRAPATSKPQWLFLERLMLVSLMVSLSIVFAHKWSESRMIYLLQPCHLLLGVVSFPLSMLVWLVIFIRSLPFRCYSGVSCLLLALFSALRSVLLCFVALPIYSSLRRRY